MKVLAQHEQKGAKYSPKVNAYITIKQSYANLYHFLNLCIFHWTLKAIHVLCILIFTLFKRLHLTSSSIFSSFHYTSE